jgi:hypothetical protein
VENDTNLYDQAKDDVTKAWEIEGRTTDENSDDYDEDEFQQEVWEAQSDLSDQMTERFYEYVREYEVENEEIGKCTYLSDIESVFREFGNMLDTQKKVKGWGGLNYTNDKITYNFGMGSSRSVKFIPKVCLADAPCSEYKSLMNFINKYGRTIYWGPTYGAVNLNNYELFSAAMGGKRGVLWDEYGERIFLDNKPKKCAQLLEELRKARGTKDNMICERGEENYIDPEERKYSAYAEIECEGEKRKYLKITIKTPTGKVKYETKIF